MLRIYIRISVAGEIQCHKGMFNKYRWKGEQELSPVWLFDYQNEANIIVAELIK